MARKLGSVLVLIAVLALFAFTVSPALAHHKDDHEQGPPAREQAGDADAQGSGGGGGDDDGIDDDNDDNAHPSGKDRETNDGSTDDVQGGTQTSNPDNDGRGPERNSCKNTSEDRVGGCADKPGGTGGVDPDDQDWNNGCGNDDDFEDDNEGLCGGPDRDIPTAPAVSGEVIEGEEKVTPSKPEVRTDKVSDQDEVLGERIFRAPARVAAAQEVATAPATLPFTGASVIAFAVLGLGMMGAGWALVRRAV